MYANVKDRKYVGMIESAGRASFHGETLHPVRVRCERAGQDLDCDLTVQARVLRAIDFTHTTGADRAEDPVRAEHGACFQGGQTAVIIGKSCTFPKCLASVVAAAVTHADDLIDAEVC